MYEHNAKYYETDQMAIVHHSNYIRWMEEARMDFMEKEGFGCDRLESEGIILPIVGVECRYESMTKFNETVQIEVFVEKYTGARVELGYVMRDKTSGKIRARGKSVNCFMKDGKVRPLSKLCPAFDELLRRLCQTHASLA